MASIALRVKVPVLPGHSRPLCSKPATTGQTPRLPLTPTRHPLGLCTGCFLDLDALSPNSHVAATLPTFTPARCLFSRRGTLTAVLKMTAHSSPPFFHLSPPHCTPVFLFPFLALHTPGVLKDVLIAWAYYSVSVLLCEGE